jgi:hypothetical protein
VPDDYDAERDFAGSLEEGYRVIRDRIAGGGPGWASNAEKLACIEREIQIRRTVYLRRVHAGTMSKETALREIELMKAIAADYRAKGKLAG